MLPRRLRAGIDNKDRVLSLNVWCHLLRLVAPVPAALVVIPILLSHFGPERYGVLSILWTVLGYLALMDLGLGRAITRIVASRSQGQTDGGFAIRRTLLFMLLIGFFGATCLTLAAVRLTTYLGVPNDLRSETVGA